jgi:predicted DNA-binding protein (UPF0251 family)
MSLHAPGQTPQPTALVHEAYLRLTHLPEPQSRDGRGHFFSEAAELIKLRFFAGLSNLEAAPLMKIPERTAKRRWACARAWLLEDLRSGS